MAWPIGRDASPGSYQVSVSAHDRRGAGTARGAHTSGGELTVEAPAPVRRPHRRPPHATAPSRRRNRACPPVPRRSPTVRSSRCAGPHNFGGPENRFGAPRDGYIHQGQDVLTAEGTPVVVPLAGTIRTTSYQAGGAGYYAVEHTYGFDFMFAHCQADRSQSARADRRGRAALCRAGQTGDATAPHLHFEMWVGGLAGSRRATRSTPCRISKLGNGAHEGRAGRRQPSRSRGR